MATVTITVEVPNDKVKEAVTWANAVKGMTAEVLRHRFNTEAKIGGDFTVLDEPLTEQQCRERMDGDGYIEGVIAVDLGELIDHNLEGVLDLMSERLCDPVLSDISYEIVGHQGGATLYVKVTGSVADYLDDEDEEDDERAQVVIVCRCNALELTDNLDQLAKLVGREPDDTSEMGDYIDVLYYCEEDEAQELRDKVEAAKFQFVSHFVIG